jgi:hypothetical protein
MSRNARSRLGLGLAAAVTTAVLVPAPVAAHAIGSVFTLPVPLALYLAGAGLAVAASFVVSVVVVRPAGPVPGYPRWPIGSGVSRVASLLLQVVGLAWWLAAILTGYLLNSISLLPAVLFWILIWAGLPIAAVLFGNPWPSLSPFRTLFGLLERVAQLIGLDRLDAGLAYPARLARWPTVALLFGALWCELVLPDRGAPVVVANVLLGYTIFTLLGMVLFGRVAWLRSAELFEVLLGWFGRVGPLGRRVVDATACEGCSEACDPDRCIDCPECAIAAEPSERRPELRPWFVGLTEVRGAAWSDAAFIVLALAGVTYDGLKETAFWNGLSNPIFLALFDMLGALNTIYLVQTGGLIVIWLVFMAAFTIAARLTRALHDPGRTTAPLGPTVGAYAATLLPIASGYLIAHYLTLVLQAVLWLPELLVNPLSSVAPLLDWMPVSAIWYLSVGAIVVGHIVAVVLAHRHALREAASRPVLAGLPLVLLMVAYTVLSLWIIAAPITLEPGTTPAAALPR